MTWQESIVKAHTAVTDAVSHRQRLQSDRYFVWQEDGARDFVAENCHLEKAVTGTMPVHRTLTQSAKDAFEASLYRMEIAWYLNSIQFEEDTGFTHYEWVWEVACG